MTPTETKEFFSRAFVAFPSVPQWLKEASVDPSATLSTWQRTLEPITLEEADMVLDGWITGDIPNPPTGYRRELFAIDLKGCAMRDRDERKRETRREEQWVKSNRGNYQPSAAFRSVAKPFGEMMEWKAKLWAGEITDSEYDQKVDEIVARAFE